MQARARPNLRAAWPTVNEQPHAAGSVLEAWRDWREPPPLIVIGSGIDEAAWVAEIERLERDGMAVYRLAGAGALPETLRAKRDTAAAFVCQGMRCFAPASTPAELPLASFT